MKKLLYPLYLLFVLAGCLFLLFSNYASSQHFPLMVWVLLGNIPSSLIFYTRIRSFVRFLIEHHPHEVKKNKLPIRNSLGKPHMSSLDLFAYYDIISKFSSESKELLDNIKRLNQILMLTFIAMVILIILGFTL